MQRVDVKLKNNPYLILIDSNLLSESGKLINEVLPSEKHKKVFIITDKNVSKFGYDKTLNQSLTKKGYIVSTIVLNSGENTKSFKTFENTANQILKEGITRNDFLIALGGGVIGDLTGFLASVLLRGIPFIQIPTTLLSQVDSSVGGKTAINSEFGKNLIGTFYQPKLVLIDINTLTTISKRDLKSGYTEALKYGLIMNKEFFDYCIKNGKNCIKLDLNTCKYIVAKSCEFKADIVAQDEFETKGIRAILNLGHTFGHAYEKIAKFNEKKLKHGEAVGLGIINAFQIGKNLGLNSENDLNKILEHFKELKLFNFDDLKKVKEFHNISKHEIISAMKKDKKSDYNKINLVLCNDIGNSKLYKDILESDIEGVLPF